MFFNELPPQFNIFLTGFPLFWYTIREIENVKWFQAVGNTAVHEIAIAFT